MDASTNWSDERLELFAAGCLEDLSKSEKGWNIFGGILILGTAGLNLWIGTTTDASMKKSGYYEPKNSFTSMLLPPTIAWGIYGLWCMIGMKGPYETLYNDYKTSRIKETTKLDYYITPTLDGGYAGLTYQF